MSSRALTREELIEKCVEVCNAITNSIVIWWPVLSAGDEVPEDTKMRVFPVFYGCVLDVALAPSTKLKDICDQIAKLDDIRLHRNAVEIAIQCSFASDYIASLSKSEQIFMKIIRDRSVHGYLNGSSEPKRKFTFIFEPKQGFIQEQISREDRLRAVSEVYGATTAEKIFNIYRKSAPLLNEYHKGALDILKSSENIRTALLEGDRILMGSIRSQYTIC